ITASPDAHTVPVSFGSSPLHSAFASTNLSPTSMIATAWQHVPWRDQSTVRSSSAVDPSGSRTRLYSLLAHPPTNQESFTNLCFRITESSGSLLGTCASIL